MKIPKKIKMFGYNWTVKIVKNREGGAYNWERKQIIIGPRNQEVVLLHELLEAIITKLFYRFYDGEGSMEYRYFFDHTGLTRIAEAFYQVLKDNKLIL